MGEVSALRAVHLAQRQLEIDRLRTGRFPELRMRKLAKVTASPLAFFRGSAPLFYEILRSNAELGRGPEDEGWITGDAHLENFGVFSTTIRSPKGTRLKKRVVFNLNDFDEATRGPWRWDVLRLMTSLILGGRELGISGIATLELADHLAVSYLATAFEGVPIPPPPLPVAALVERATLRSKKELLDARTTAQDGERRFVRGERYRTLPADITRQIPQSLETYAAELDSPRPTSAQLEVIDAAQRIAGNGSLGALRVAVLTRGKGGADGGWVFDMKEQFAPSAYPVPRPEDFPFAERVARACRACLEHPPRMLGTTWIGKINLLVRRLTPQEDKLNLSHLKADTLKPLAGYLGALLATAHVRGAEQAARAAWTSSDRFELLERAVALAGLYEATYLELCLLARALH